MKYLMLIKHSESYRKQAIPKALLDAMGDSWARGSKAAS